MSRKKEEFVPSGRFSYGSDPEFSFFKDGQVVPASSIISDEDCTEQVGLDGASSTGELRPDSGKSAMEHFIHIRGTLQRLAEIAKENDIAVDCIGNHQALGCHIHIGLPVPKEKLRGCWSNMHNGNYMGLDKDCIHITRQVLQLVTALDYFLGEQFINFSGEARGGYKIRKAWREKIYGIEYRTLPAIVIQDPVGCAMILNIVERITEATWDLSANEHKAFLKAMSPSFRIRGWLGINKYKKFVAFRRAYNNKALRALKQGTTLESWGFVPSGSYNHLISFDDGTWACENKQLVKELLKDITTPIKLIGLASEQGEMVFASNLHLEIPGMTENTDYSYMLGQWYYNRNNASYWRTHNDMRHYLALSYDVRNHDLLGVREPLVTAILAFKAKLGTLHLISDDANEEPPFNEEPPCQVTITAGNYAGIHETSNISSNISPEAYRLEIIDCTVRVESVDRVSVESVDRISVEGVGMDDQEVAGAVPVTVLIAATVTFRLNGNRYRVLVRGESMSEIVDNFATTLNIPRQTVLNAFMRYNQSSNSPWLRGESF